jgi:hypothetical protein
MGEKETAMNGKNRIIRALGFRLLAIRGLEAMSAAFDYTWTAKARWSRSGRLGTHTRSIQAHLRAARSSPPRP